ncbi:MAG: hypothetical protein IAF58_14930 [Leptolyngbya sp.]|nr:hypothetical protein [Candidatus Melainabacteria bacterium]
MKIKYTFCSLAVLGCLLGLYVLTILWRVGAAESDLMGKDLLLHIFPSKREFVQAPVVESHGSSTYKMPLGEGEMTVWREKINGFQHTYGSALASYELGEFLADKLFVACEFCEFTFDRNGVAETDLRDRRRDLSNNWVGRQIGLKAREQGLNGADAEEFIKSRILAAMEFDHLVITHPFAPSVLNLPTEEELGCPFLPTKNAVNIVQRMRFRVKRRIAIARTHVRHRIEVLLRGMPVPATSQTSTS